MGKKKKGFNWKAREQPGGQLDTEEISRFNKSMLVNPSDQADGSNALVLPSNKLKLKKDTEVQSVGKILSKKQRKRLEKIVDVKKKKAGRSELLEALSKVQVDTSLLSRLESLSSAQTKGVKRQLVEEEHAVQIMQTEGKQIHEIEDLKKIKKKKLKRNEEDNRLPTGDNVLGFDSSDTETSEDETEDGEPPRDIAENTAKDSEGGENGDSKETDAGLEEKTNKMSETGSDERPAEIKSSVNHQVENKKDKPKEKILPVSSSSFKPVSSVVYVPVDRDPDIIASRNKLPIIGEEQQIMDCINKNQVIILSGETGSGKTTQVPQFLYEAGYSAEGKMIGVTEPRRVAATAMSARVAVELNLPPSEVSYQIRFEGNVTKDTKIKFMTDGVLLREIEKDFLLSKYSVIILDEAHERSVFTDILVGLLSRIVPLRHKKQNPLKLIIMSATLRVEDFTKNDRLFKSVPPVISVESRQFPVTVHFNKRTAEDYLGEAYRKVCKIHRQLPEGGVLVFLTGQMEVNQLVRKLRQTFPGGVSENPEKEEDDSSNLADKKSAKKRKKKVDVPEKKMEDLPEINLDNYRIEPPDQLECEGDLSEEEEDADDRELELGREEGSVAPLHVLPLYSLLSQEKQNRIFEAPPAGARLCVVATNIAETSLTIPGVKYVVDSGRVKTKFYDKVTGVSTFVVGWTSQAAANQRAGRAGRQGPGHTYRLYSSAVFNNDMKDFVSPEIQEKPADGLLLQMKAMNIDKVVNFPFPSPPDKVQLRVAEDRLQLLQLLTAPAPGLPLKEVERIKFTSTVTSLGKVVASFPVAPRFGKILALSHQHNLLPLAVALVAALSVQEVLVEKPVGGEGGAPVPKKIMDIRKEWVGQRATLCLGDPMVLLCALSMAEKCSDTDEFCSSVGLRPKALKEIRRLRRQLCTEIESIMPGVEYLLQPGLAPPTQDEARMLQQLLLAGCGDQVARRIEEGEEGFQKGAYRIGAMQQPVFIHSTSVLKKKRPSWLVYQEVYEADKVYLRGITEIRPEWLAKYTPALCNLGSAVEDPPPRYSQSTGTVRGTFTGTFGPGSFPLPAVEVEYPTVVDKFKYFAKFLLEGQVCPQLKAFSSSLLSNPLIMTKSWSNLQPRTEVIYKTLASEKIGSAKQLKKKWETDPQFLLKAYLSWLPEVLADDVIKVWPPEVEL